MTAQPDRPQLRVVPTTPPALPPTATYTEPAVITGRGTWAYCRTAVLRHVTYCAHRATAHGSNPIDCIDLDLMQAKGDARAFGWTDTEIAGAVRAGMLEYLAEVL